jgi:uncharacterized membrane protein
MMAVFQAALLSATLLCTLVAGFVLAFAVVIMPGLAVLGDREFIRAFQVMDRVIQNNRPLFMLVWVGSIVALVAAGVLGVPRLEGLDRGLLIAAVVLYLLGVQLPTLTLNVPLNNQLQQVVTEGVAEIQLAEVREAFESRWNLWNEVRTILAVATSVLLILLVVRL